MLVVTNDLETLFNKLNIEAEIVCSIGRISDTTAKILIENKTTKVYNVIESIGLPITNDIPELTIKDNIILINNKHYYFVSIHKINNRVH